MHTEAIKKWQHSHDFSYIHEKGESRTRLVLAITATTMVVEIIAGSIFGSMALLADGWHMGTHVAALSIAAFAYWFARRYADSSAFSFGTGKVGALGGFASAIALAIVALLMIVESMQRLVEPIPIHFNQALIVAALGLVVNVACALMLQHGHDHHDLNLRAAYLHVIADALTSVCAIVALGCGRLWGWQWLDPLMGMAGGAVIAVWAWGLLKETGGILLDAGHEAGLTEKITHAIEADADNRITDLHVWQVGPSSWAMIVSIATHTPRSSEFYKNLLSNIPMLSHITVETIWFEGTSCVQLESKSETCPTSKHQKI